MDAYTEMRQYKGGGEDSKLTQVSQRTGAKVHDGLSDVLLRRVPQHIHLGLVGPKHVACAREPVHRNRRLVQEV